MYQSLLMYFTIARMGISTWPIETTPYEFIYYVDGGQYSIPFSYHDGRYDVL